MTVGDVLEWIAGLALCAAAYLAVGLPLALVALGVALAYFGQCYDHELPKAHRRPRRSPAAPLWPSGPPTSTYHCAFCGGDSPNADDHACSEVAR